MYCEVCHQYASYVVPEYPPTSMLVRRMTDEEHKRFGWLGYIEHWACGDPWHQDMIRMKYGVRGHDPLYDRQSEYPIRFLFMSDHEIMEYKEQQLRDAMRGALDDYDRNNDPFYR